MNTIVGALSSGLPLLFTQLAVTLVLLAIGVGCYLAVMPFNEIRLIRAGNNAAGIVLGGGLVALAIPLAATLASSHVTLDIIVWGAIALAIQLIAFFAVAAVLHGLRGMIEQGNTAAATLLVGILIAVALLNAGAVAG